MFTGTLGKCDEHLAARIVDRVMLQALATLDLGSAT